MDISNFDSALHYSGAWQTFRNAAVATKLLIGSLRRVARRVKRLRKENVERGVIDESCKTIAEYHGLSGPAESLDQQQPALFLRGIVHRVHRFVQSIGLDQPRPVFFVYIEHENQVLFA